MAATAPCLFVIKVEVMDSQTSTSPCAENDTDGDSDKKAKDAASADSAMRGSSLKEEKEGWAESRLNGLDTPAAMDKTAAGESSQQGNGDSADLDLADDDGVGCHDKDGCGVAAVVEGLSGSVQASGRTGSPWVLNVLCTRP